MAKKKSNPAEEFVAMSDAAKDAAVAKYDRPLPVGRDGLPGRPLTAADKALHRRAAARGALAKMGRPMVGAGAKIVPVSIERGLLEQADRFARKHKLKRSHMVAEGLRLVMQRAKAG